MGSKLDYDHAKSELKHMIINAKRTKWIELLNELDRHIRGEGCKVMHGLRKVSPPYFPSTHQHLNIVKELFRTETNDSPRISQVVERVTIFMKEGVDYLSTEAVIILSDTIPDVLCDIFNLLLTPQEFPKYWKEAKVVLLQRQMSSVTSSICS
ncbi:hypothetical protein QE152_g38401 [Popillia japonica]|uniref:Uncharacterized protein n=1 Tax=Popillia japonica TaxID=7064 RepID=A0AAW1HX81_POPJA